MHRARRRACGTLCQIQVRKRRGETRNRRLSVASLDRIIAHLKRSRDVMDIHELRLQNATITMDELTAAFTAADEGFNATFRELAWPLAADEDAWIRLKRAMAEPIEFSEKGPEGHLDHGTQGGSSCTTA